MCLSMAVAEALVEVWDLEVMDLAQALVAASGVVLAAVSAEVLVALEAVSEVE